MTNFFQELPRTPMALELVAFPLAVSIRQDNRVTIALLLLLLFLSAMWHQRSAERLNLIPTALFMVCVVLVFWQGPFTIAGMYVLAALILINTARAVSRATAYASLLAGLSLYLVSNVAGWLLGLQSASTTVRIGGYETSETLFGARRVFFPFALSINEPAFVASALIVAVVAMISIRQKPGWHLWAGVAAGIVVILASNSRTPILFAVPLAVLLLVAPRLTRIAAPYAIGLAMLMPFLLQQLQPILNWVGGLVASNEYLARGQDVQDLVGLSSRQVIWTSSIDFWSTHVTDTMHQLIGYGYFGHATSGASASYSAGVGSYFTESTAVSMHSPLLQTLFDAGLAGAAILLGITVYAVYRYGRHAETLPMLAVVVMLGLSSTTEAILAPGFGNTPVFLLLYLLVFIPKRAVTPLDSISKSAASPSVSTDRKGAVATTQM
jgi:hypothetical protein